MKEVIQGSDLFLQQVVPSNNFETINDDEITLSPEEEKAAVEAAIRKAKSDKAVRLRSIAYLEKISKPAEYPPISSVELGKMIMRYAKSNIPGFVIDDHNREVFKLLCQYFTQDPDFEKQGYSLGKGILFYGNIGSGKTTLMRLFMNNPTNDYVMRSCRKVADDYAKKDDGGPEALLKYSDLIPVYPGQHYGQKWAGMCFDDLGTERSKKHFGNEVNVMEDVLQNRYDLRLIGKTHLTTNLTRTEISELYGPRVGSRLYEMCNVIAFPTDADDRRKITP